MVSNFESIKEEDFLNLLQMLSLNDLKKPIIEMPKKYRNEHHGFRAEKIVDKKVYAIYTKFIFQLKDEALSKYTLFLLKEAFERLGLIEIMDSGCDAVEKAYKIYEQLIGQEKLYEVLPILIISETAMSDEEQKIIKTQEDQFNKIIDILNKSQLGRVDDGKKDTPEDLAKENIALQDKNKQLIKDLKNLKAQYNIVLAQEKARFVKKNDEYKAQCNKKLNDQKVKYEELIGKLTFDCNGLQIKYDNVSKINKILTDKVEESLAKIKQIADNNVSMQQENNKYASKIDELERRLADILSQSINKEDVHAMVYEMVGELRKISNINKEFIDKALIRLENKQIDSAWIEMSEEENFKISEIVCKMISNKAVSDDIIELEQIEDNVCMKYVIIKKLQELFFAFLERKAQEVDTLNKIMCE